MLIKVGNDLFRILELHHLTPGNKRAHVQCRMRNIRNLTLSDEKFRAEEDVQRAVLDEREMQYLYNDGDGYHFMDQANFETMTLGADILGDDRLMLSDNLVVQLQKFNGRPIGMQLPPLVELVVTNTEPGVRGDTASGNVTKPAVLETGLEIRVPLFIKEGEKVKVHTETREFAGRA